MQSMFTKSTTTTTNASTNINISSNAPIPTNPYSTNKILTNLPFEIFEKIIFYGFPKKECDIQRWYNLLLVNKYFYSILCNKYMVSKYIKYLTNNNLINFDNDFIKIHSHINILDIYKIIFKKLVYSNIYPIYNKKITNTMYTPIHINEILQIPVLPDLNYPNKDYITLEDEYKLICSKIEETNQPIWRGINSEGQHILCFRLYDTTKNKYQVEYLYYCNRRNEWCCYSFLKEDIYSYMGDITHCNRRMKDEENSLIYYENGCVCDFISYDYFKRIFKKEKCGTISERNYNVTRRKYGMPIDCKVTYCVEAFGNGKYYEHGLREHQNMLSGPLVIIK